MALYVAVTSAGSISFHYNYSINGRQETITFGRYGVGGITLAEACERLSEAKWMVADGKSPAKEKARDKVRVKGAETFGAWVEKWLRGYQMADSTCDMRRSVYTRELETKFGNQKLTEITHEDLRALTDTIVECGAPATRFMRVRSYFRYTAGRLSEARRLIAQQTWLGQQALPGLSREIDP